jgi:hypothetical protein
MIELLSTLSPDDIIICQNYNIYFESTLVFYFEILPRVSPTVLMELQSYFLWSLT